MSREERVVVDGDVEFNGSEDFQKSKDVCLIQSSTC
jgi:hypothetical protein